jgi:hypothetical protein
LEVSGDDVHDGLADLVLTGAVFRFAGSWIGHAQVGAQDVDAGLALGRPVVGQAGHGVDAGEADRGPVAAELVGGIGVPVGELLGVGTVGVAFGQALLAVGIQPREQRTHEGQHRQCGLDDLERVHLRRGTGNLDRDRQRMQPPKHQVGGGATQDQDRRGCFPNIRQLGRMLPALLPTRSIPLRCDERVRTAEHGPPATLLVIDHA